MNFLTAWRKSVEYVPIKFENAFTQRTEMNLANFVTGPIGIIHLVSSVLALVSGSSILMIRKGTRKHRVTGRFYGYNMLVVFLTSFMMYRLFGVWGIFHWSALLGILTLVAGLTPILLKKPKGNYLSLHFGFMYWSVIGLYEALLSEILVRIPKAAIVSAMPNNAFYLMTAIGTVLVAGRGVYFFVKQRPKWEKQFRLQGA